MPVRCHTPIKVDMPITAGQLLLACALASSFYTITDVRNFLFTFNKDTILSSGSVLLFCVVQH